MRNLSATTDKIELITSSGADIDCVVDYAEVANPVTSSSSPTLDVKQTLVTAAATTDVSGSPAGSSVRNIKTMNFRNIDAAGSNDVTVRLNRNGTVATLFKCTLLAGEVLLCREGVWYHYDANGGVYGVSLPVATDTVVGGIEIADQTEMETATANDKAVTPGRLQYHPGVAKCWVHAGLTGNIIKSHNITSLTDTGTGVLTITIATDFSSSDWCALATIEFTSTTLAQSCTTDSRAAGSIVLRSVVEAGSSADPVSWAFAGFGDQ